MQLVEEHHPSMKASYREELEEFAMRAANIRVTFMITLSNPALP